VSDATFLLAVWFLFCAVSLLVWHVGRAFSRPFDMPLAFAMTMTGLAVVRNAYPVFPLRLIVNTLLCFALYYGSAWVVRFIWRLGVSMWRMLRQEEELTHAGDGVVY
jgi:hypothetical protein